MSESELTDFEKATEKGYFGADPSSAAQAETREADQTQGGPLLEDEQRSPVSGERHDTDADGEPVDPDTQVTAAPAPAKAKSHK